MRLLIITQKDPFYLADSIKFLINKLPVHSAIIGCVVFDVSPFGKKEQFIKKAKRTYKIFGFNFFIHYTIEYMINLLDKSKNVEFILKSHNIPIIRLKKNINNPESLNVIKSYKPDLLISIAGNQIFRKPLLELAPKGCINLHTSILPKYRGLMPTFWVLKNGEKQTGASVFFVDEGIDSGPIIVQRKIDIAENETQKSLIKKSKRIGMEAIIEAVNKIHNNEPDPIPNPDELMTYYSFPTRNDVKEFYKLGKRFF